MTKSQTKIVFLGSQMERAGAQQMLLAQAGWFAKQGYDTKAVFFYDKQGLQSEWQAALAFPVISLDGWVFGKPLLSNGAKLVGALLRLIALLRGTDVVVAFTPTSNLLGLPLAWLAGVRARIGTHHGHIEGTKRSMDRLHGWLTNSFLCTRMVTVSEQVRQYALTQEGAKPGKLVVIENGVEPSTVSMSIEEQRQVRSQAGVPGNGKMLLTVGRLVLQKGHTVLLKAIARLPKDDRRRFVFAGTGTLQPELASEATALGIADQVIFLGLRDDIPQLLASAHIFIQPSLWEGLSLALLEAMFAGVPIVASRVEGTIDVLEDGVNALLVSINNDKELADAIQRMLVDDTLRNKLAAVAKLRAQENYSLDRMCNSYQELIATSLQ